jgi:phospholipase/carboxylesterase
MAFRMAFNHPQRFAGVLSLGGCLPSGHTPLARLSELRRLQLFLASGRDSQEYQPEHVCQDLRLIYTAGMAVNLRQYPCGDELTTHMLTDMDRWIMDQLAATASVNSSAASYPGQ